MAETARIAQELSLPRLVTAAIAVAGLIAVGLMCPIFLDLGGRTGIATGILLAYFGLAAIAVSAVCVFLWIFLEARIFRPLFHLLRQGVAPRGRGVAGRASLTRDGWDWSQSRGRSTVCTKTWRQPEDRRLKRSGGRRPRVKASTTGWNRSSGTSARAFWFATWSIRFCCTTGRSMAAVRGGGDGNRSSSGGDFRPGAAPRGV